MPGSRQPAQALESQIRTEAGGERWRALRWRASGGMAKAAHVFLPECCNWGVVGARLRHVEDFGDAPDPATTLEVDHELHARRDLLRIAS